MAKIEGICRDVLDNAQWVAIATTGDDGAHLVGTWGAYIKSLGIKDDETGPCACRILSSNRRKPYKEQQDRDCWLELEKSPGVNGPGKGCLIRGKRTDSDFR